MVGYVVLSEGADFGPVKVDDWGPERMLPLCRMGPVGALIKGRFLTTVFCPRQGVNARGMFGLGSLEPVVFLSMV